KAGFTDLSVDLIYGSPTTNDTVWADNISRVLDYGVPHISAYALTVEPKTALAHQIKTGKSPAPEEGRFAKQFDMLVERLSLAGYEHYEISNFALPGRYSRHNTGYWQGKPYVGIGPAAHSFNGYDQRRWNIANNALYTRQFEALHSWEDYAKSSGLYTIENLSKANRYNEFVMTSLRTKWGVTIEALTEKFGADFAEYFQTSLADSLQHGYFEVQALKKGIFQLNTQGRRLADGIAAEAFFIPEM
ncbi:MAG: coproporphyrinogen III oxidase, partial [Bacteroidota bacterium]